MRQCVSDDVAIPVEGLTDPPGVVREPSVEDFPSGYAYGVTRYADLILRDAFPVQFRDLCDVLEEFRSMFRKSSRGVVAEPRIRVASTRSWSSVGGANVISRSPN